MPKPRELNRENDKPKIMSAQAHHHHYFGSLDDLFDEFYNLHLQVKPRGRSPNGLKHFRAIPIGSYFSRKVGDVILTGSKREGKASRGIAFLQGRR